MTPATATWLRRWNGVLHRDIGYFLASFVAVYCVSGLALNHVDQWNPDFIIEKREVRLDRVYTREEVDVRAVARFGGLVGEERYRLFDFPTDSQVKIYYDNASLHLRLRDQTGVYERIVRRPFFYDANVLHKNSLKGWRWCADAFSVLLLVLAGTGLFVLRGRHGLGGRGKWLLLAGALPPAAALMLFRAP